MASDKLAIHILPDSNPQNISEMILLLANNAELSFTSSKELVDYLRNEGVNANDWVQSTSSSMRILEKADGVIRLSSNGFALARVREEARGDLLHFLMYSGWDARRPLDFLQSWGYRNCCDRYWAAGEVELTGAYLDRQVEDTINEAREAFAAMKVGEFDEISFSRKSLNGAHRWLLALEPPVLHPNTPDAKDRIFRRRSFCQPELIVLALAWVLRHELTVTGVEILLTREKREALCKACLLSPEALDRVLDWAIPTFPALLSPGTRAGVYGRFVRLHKIPTLKDVIR
jgi:hypothetical protein